MENIIKISEQDLAQLIDERVMSCLRRFEVQKREISDYLTRKETANLLRCTIVHVDNLASRRKLKRHKNGSRTLFKRSDVLAYLEKEKR